MINHYCYYDWLHFVMSTVIKYYYYSYYYYWLLLLLLLLVLVVQFVLVFLLVSPLWLWLFDVTIITIAPGSAPFRVPFSYDIYIYIYNHFIVNKTIMYMYWIYEYITWIIFMNIFLVWLNHVYVYVIFDHYNILFIIIIYIKTVYNNNRFIMISMFVILVVLLGPSRESLD